MFYRIFLFFLIVTLVGCVSQPPQKKIDIDINKIPFETRGFALIYEDSLYKNKSITKKIDNRSLLIFQRNLKMDTPVRVTNLINSKYIIAKVGSSSNYPFFFNSVISQRISDELKINKNEPYVEIKEIVQNSLFVAKKAKTYEEEKHVATKAPVDDIKIKDLSIKSENNKISKKDKFHYIIKIADFYFQNSANQMKSRILKETSVESVEISKISNTQFRVYIGPYDNLNSLKRSFNAINVLQFENIEIIKK